MHIKLSLQHQVVKYMVVRHCSLFTRLDLPRTHLRSRGCGEEEKPISASDPIPRGKVVEVENLRSKSSVALTVQSRNKNKLNSGKTFERAELMPLTFQPSSKVCMQSLTRVLRFWLHSVQC